MPKFTMRLDIDIHDHSPTQHRHFITAMLDQVKQAVGPGHLATEGEITTPAIGAVSQAIVGSWAIEKDVQVKSTVAA